MNPQPNKYPLTDADIANIKASGLRVVSKPANLQLIVKVSVKRVQERLICQI